MLDSTWTPEILRYNRAKEKNCNEIRKKFPPNICPMPFTTLILNPDGKVGFCRERTNHDVIGNIKNQTWQEIWNGEKIRAIRKEFLTGNIQTCRKQIKDRRCFEQCFNQIILPYTSFSEYQTNPPLRLSPDFNGQCNLQCVCCDIWQMPNGLYDEIGFWEKAQKEIFPHLKIIDPLAGEPFIQKDFYRLIDLMTEINPDCAWRFTTNLHWEFDVKIKNTLDKIKNIYGFICSIDAATPETYHKVRFPGRLEVVHKCLKNLIAYRSKRINNHGPFEKFGITVAMALHRENWHEAPAFMRWGHNLGVEPALQGVYLPKHLTLFDGLELEKKKEILDFYISEMRFRDLIHIFRITTPLMASLGEELEHEYKHKIVKAYCDKTLDVFDIWECSEWFPRFLETFSSSEKMDISQKLLDHSLNNLSVECLKLQNTFMFLEFLSSHLPETVRKIYKKKILFTVMNTHF